MMKLYRSLVFRELRLTRKKYVLLLILFVLLAAMFVLPAFSEDIFFDDTTETEKYLTVVLFTIIPAATGSFFAGSNNGIHKADINTGWKRYCIVLPVTPSQKAAADLIVKLTVFIPFCLVALGQVLLYSALGFGTTTAHSVNVYLAAGAISMLFDCVYSGIIMLAKDKDEMKLFGLFAGAVGLGLLLLVENSFSLISHEKGDNGEMISERALKSFFDFLGSGKFALIAAAAFIMMCAVYYAVMRKVHGRREP